MKYSVLLLALFLLNHFIGTEAAKGNTTLFDWKLANTSVELTDVSYCKPDTYSKHTFAGQLEGFKLATRILTFNAFVGTLPSERSIYVVFGGSSSLIDWLFDVDVHLADYPHCDKCKVHQGYFIDQALCNPIIISTVTVLSILNPHYKIVVTGHSKGAAQATLAALDLIHAGFKNVNLVTFGSPRVGNAAFAAYASNKLGLHYRMTHYMDIIPSIPTRRQGYTHLSGEWYEHPTLSLHQCSGFEDPDCNAQWGAKLGLDKAGDIENLTDDDPAENGPDSTDSTDTGDPTELHPLAPLWLDLIRHGARDHMHYLGRELGCKLQDIPPDVDSTHLRALPLLSPLSSTVHKESPSMQLRLLRFAFALTIIMLMLFCIGVWVVGRADYRRTLQTHTAPTALERDTESTPLVSNRR